MKELFDTIYHRKAIRKYNMTPLGDDLMQSVTTAIHNVKPLDTSIRCEIVIKNQNEVNTTVKAPHYLCFYSEKKGNYLMNAGYMIQQMDLSLSQMGLGACWVGMAKPKETLRNGMSFIILIIFGRPAETAQRESVSEFKRKSFDEITDIEDDGGIVAAARLAPSAINSQPWIFTSYDGKIVISREKPGILKAPFLSKVNQIDIGITMCHMQIAAESIGKHIVFSYEGAPVPNHSIYMATATVEDIE